MLSREEPPRLVQAKTLLETDVTGVRTFTVQVNDNSMQPLFSEGEITLSTLTYPPSLIIMCWSRVMTAILMRRSYGRSKKAVASRFFTRTTDGTVTVL